MTKSRKTHDSGTLHSKKGSLGYYFFYLLFSPDFWRLLIGVGVALWLAPQIFRPDMTPLVRGMLYIMLAVIGWAASGVPAGWICQGLKRLALGNRMPPAR